jgi:hypothetical protein
MRWCKILKIDGVKKICESEVPSSVDAKSSLRSL